MARMILTRRKDRRNKAKQPDTSDIQMLDRQSKTLQRVLETSNSEIDRQLSELAKSGTAISQRATILLTTATLFTALNGDKGNPPWLYVASLIASGLAVIFSITALFVRSKALSLKLTEIDPDFKPKDANADLKNLVNQKIKMEKDRRSQLNTQLIFLRIGYVFLLISVICSIVFLANGGNPSVQPPTP